MNKVMQKNHKIATMKKVNGIQYTVPMSETEVPPALFIFHQFATLASKTDKNNEVDTCTFITTSAASLNLTSVILRVNATHHLEKSICACKDILGPCLPLGFS